jgi:RimJ/RimL family protein N-acetyltransferase
MKEIQSEDVKHPLILHGERIYLRPPTTDDAFTVYEWENDDEVWTYDRQRSHEPDFATFLATFDRECEDVPGNRQHYRFIVEDENHRPIGFIGYFNLTYINRDVTMGQVEIGVGLGEKTYWGKGYGTDAIRTLTNYLFTQSYIVRVYAQTAADNQAARRAFAKVDFVEVGQTRDLWIELERRRVTDSEEENEYK